MSESQKTNIDPTTGRALPKGVWYHSPSQYQARKMVDGKRIRKTFASAALARRWLNEKRVEINLGPFRDTCAIDRIPIRQLIERYRDECMPTGRMTASVIFLPCLTILWHPAWRANGNLLTYVDFVTG
ncbi:hypothetical protein ACOZ4Y_06735 [Komagataeibacter rhaeticus]|uniref:hypothetical protein n=1 Tax=Komagataeibacter rhaeticus TaxID=215221 RepID=UPI0004D9DE01|nr:hypothetical protein [Komagataeibacter rhaeticus]KDU95081.1 hypothetical protein GLUCORHAEAF1_10305 [Komagataeibacter rhaeticus AF1]GBQ10252.1 phage DNA recombinase [Komagataeibacter rhaeticus DSM 16663]